MGLQAVTPFKEALLKCCCFSNIYQATFSNSVFATGALDVAMEKCFDKYIWPHSIFHITNFACFYILEFCIKSPF